MEGAMKDNGQSGEKPVDWNEFHRFLTLLGRNQKAASLVIALFPKNQGEPCIHFACTPENIPERRIEELLRKKPSLSLGLVINPPSVKPKDWGNDPSHFSGRTEEVKERRCREWNRGRRRFNRACPPKAWGSKAEQISHATAVWFECDGSMSLEEQAALAQKAGLPKPSFTVWTGGKSLHCYYLLSEPIPKERFREVMERLCLTIEGAAPDAGVDRAIKNANRIMRAPGGLHGSTRMHCRVHEQSGTVYRLKDLEQKLSSMPSRSLDGGSHYSKRRTSNYCWFDSLSASEQKEQAIEMLRVIPKRLQPSAQGGPVGTRAPAIKVLYGLVGHFGHTIASEICAHADWRNQWWSPDKEIQTISDPQCGIGVVIKTAREHGWNGGGINAVLEEKVKRFFSRQAERR